MKQMMQLAKALVQIAIVSACVWGSASAEPPSTYTIQTLDLPGAISTRANGINNQGDIVGVYTTVSGVHAFLLSKGVVRDLMVPEFGIRPRCINNRGDVAGVYFDADGEFHGFLLSAKGRFTTIDLHGANSTLPASITDQGEVVGYFDDGTGVLRGFKYRDGSISYFPTPGISLVDSFPPAESDNGIIVGTFDDQIQGDTHGFVLRDGRQTTLTYLDAPFTSARSCNPYGVVVGTYAYFPGQGHGWVWQEGAFTLLEVPGAFATSPNGINASGTIVGTYIDSQKVRHGFLAIPSV